MITNNTNDIMDENHFELASKLKRLSNILFSESKKIYQNISNDFEQSSYNILSLLFQKNSLSIKTIAAQLKVTHPAAVQIVNKLIKKQLVEKFDSPDDKRITIVKITDRGRKLYISLLSIAEKIDLSYKEIINEVDPKFLLTLSLIEEKIKLKSIAERVGEKVKDEQIKNIKIVRYHREYQNKFKELNLEWLNKYFEVEDEDKKALDDPKNYYIKNNGEIFFALDGNEIAGTCAIKKISKGIFELSKMAVAEKHQGKQLGKKLALTAIGYAYEKGAEKVVLDTSPVLTSAINLYKKLGFEILEANTHGNYKRSLFKMELKLK
ncbi:MAG: bifunctional helix-turn-helix transcriptional regulator/GNAT family N-acetyltransferase [Ignavibacteriaceae bacterium]